MDIKFRALAAVVLFITAISLASIWLYPNAGRSVRNLDNPGNLYPEVQRDINALVQSLKKESTPQAGWSSLKRNGAFNFVDFQDPSKHTDFISVFGDRRSLHILAQLREVSVDSRPSSVDIWLNEAFESFTGTLPGEKGFKAFVARKKASEYRFRQRQCLMFALVAACELKDSKDSTEKFLEDVEKVVQLSNRVMEAEAKASNAQIAERFVASELPEPEFLMNILSLGFDYEPESPVYYTLLPVSEWDSPVSIFEFGSADFASREGYPEFVDLDSGWREQKIFRFPSEWGYEEETRFVVQMLDDIRASL